MDRYKFSREETIYDEGRPIHAVVSVSNSRRISGIVQENLYRNGEPSGEYAISIRDPNTQREFHRQNDKFSSFEGAYDKMCQKFGEELGIKNLNSKTIENYFDKPNSK